jgi:hypothetical protein
LLKSIGDPRPSMKRDPGDILLAKTDEQRRKARARWLATHGD